MGSQSKIEKDFYTNDDSPLSLSFYNFSSPRVTNITETQYGCKLTQTTALPKTANHHVNESQYYR